MTQVVAVSYQDGSGCITEPGCVRLPGGALRHPLHSCRAADAMSGVLRTQRERASRQPASRLRRAAARFASSVPGFLRLLPARAASLALLLAALAFAQPATAQSVVDLIANDGQTSADGDAAAYGKIYATSFTTGSHSTGYELTRVTMWLKKDGMESRPGNSVDVNIHTDSGGTPGLVIGFATITDEPTTSWAGYGDGIRPGRISTLPVGIDLAADTTYWVSVRPSSNQGADDDHYLLGGTSSDNEDSGGLSGWSLGNNRLLRASDGSWDTTSTNANALRLELRGSTRAAANLPSAPTGLTVSAGTNSGELDVRWTRSSGTILDYDLRYYEGSTDPTDAADWIEEGEQGGPPDPVTVPLATITGLKSGTAYRVQVRAASVDGEGAWSASVDGTTTSRFPPSAPTGLTVSAGTNSGELDASWTAPSGTVADYDLRYYEGSADPTDAADWVEEHETNGLGTADSTATSATIKGLKASTAYRVQVRAANAVGESAWSASVAGTTNAASGTNRAPRAVTQKTGDPDTACKLWTDTSQPNDTISFVNPGSLVSLALKTRGSETTEWPTSCTKGTGNTDAPVFDDRDGGDLYYTLSYTQPDNVRGLGGEAPFWVEEGNDRLWARAIAIGSDTSVRVDLTARDEHGASASTWVRFDVKVAANAAGAPSFSATVADQTAVTGTAFSLALPAATGGDVSLFSTAINSPYTYAVSGLPAGLSFDAATRRVSGTPSATGTFTVAYTADDADGLYSLKASPGPADSADAASQTFTILVGALPSAPTGLTVSAGTNSGELDASWTAPSGTVTDYDLRYYEGSADPTDAADWVEEHETNGLGTADSTSTSATIKGLKSGTAYRVQVRAGNAYGESAWSASVSATTNAASGTNRAPRAVVHTDGDPDTACKLWTDTSQPNDTLSVSAGSLASLVLKTRGTETGEWPASCALNTGNTDAPVFDDRDGGDLYFTARYTADNVRGFGGKAPFFWDPNNPTRLFATAVAIGSDTSVRIDLTARDEHGASATTWVRFDVKVMGGPVGAPSFSATVPDQTTVTGTAFSLALPAATGGDVSKSGRAINSPYTYAVSGLPAGLSFDAATRTVSGTPTVGGTHTVTYTADDADAFYSLKASPSAADTADAASQTFTIQVTGIDPPSAPTGVTATATGTSMAVSWTAPSGTVTDYDLRYYQGQADPTDAADWIEEGEAGSPPDPGSSTSATIAGLKAEAAYRVQVRAGNTGGEGPWSASASATTAADTTAPVLQSARTNAAGTHVTLYYDEDLKTDDASVPNHWWFEANVAGNHRYPQDKSGIIPRYVPVTVSGSRVTMNLGTPAVTAGQAVSVSYNNPDTGFARTRNLAGIVAGTFANVPVINTVGDTTAPSLSLAEVNGSRLTLYYNETLDTASTPATTDFSVSVAGTARTPTHVAVSEGSVTLTLVPGVRLREQAVTVTYTVPGTNPTQDLAGNRVAAFTGHAVTNNTHEIGLKVRAGSGSGSLDASWSAPSGTVTDYDLRYYEGAADPTDAADWVEEHETDGLGTADSTATSATIKGLKADTAYRVQVRAATADGEGAWSASVSGTTRAASGTNRAPRALTNKPGQSNTNDCKLWTDTSQPAKTNTAHAGARAPIELKTRGTETEEWPDSCSSHGHQVVPVFDDRDGGDLYYTFSYTLPDNVRGLGGKAPFSLEGDQLAATAVAIGTATSVRVDLTARDEHGASATAWVRFDVGVMTPAAGAPSFSATVADQTADTGTAFSLALPAATGGDVSRFSRAINSPYTYAVSGLPAGLSFDAATRTVSGTPAAAGSFTVTYTADDADADYSLRTSPSADDLADAASQTFTIEVGEAPAAPPPPAAPTGVAATPSGTSLAVSWTAPSGTITDYDLRYYAGREDPADDADWVEEALGLPDPGTSTSATISRLSTDTVYRVQVRAANADGEGAWSDSASARIDTTAPVLRSARVSSDGTTVTLYYDEELDSDGAPAHRRFSVTVNNAERTLPGGGNETKLNAAVIVAGSTVTMELGTPAVTASQSVAVSYDAAAAAAPLKNLKGIKAPGISGLAAINDVGTTTPGALSLSSTVALTSTPTHDTDTPEDGNDTYGLGAKIEVQLTFSEAVTVDTSRGRPWLELKLHAAHSGAKRAVYESGSGTATLTFGYTVQSGDSSKGGSPVTDAGIAVVENSLALSGGLISSTATGLPANLAHPGLGHDLGHKVNGKLDAQPPRFVSATVDGDTLTVTFDEDLDTAWLPLAGRFFVSATPPGGSARTLQGSSVSISSSNHALVTVVLTEGVGSGEAVKLRYVPHHTDGPRDANGNPVTTFADKPVTNITMALGQPTGVSASASALGGSMDVSWKAPGGGTTPTGYELRYYQGTEDPPAGREADWKENRPEINYKMAGLPDPGAGATSATIEGLKANTAYRVQVRAKTAVDHGPWSVSASAITGSPKAGNNPPRALSHNGAATGSVCSVVNNNYSIKREFGVDGKTGAIVSLSNLVGREVGETGAWPAPCTGTGIDRWQPEFDDVDGDKLTLSVEPEAVPDHVQVDPGFNFRLQQPGVIDHGFTGQVTMRAVAHFRDAPSRGLRAKLTATDPHGASVSSRIFFLIEALPNVRGAPSLRTVADLDASPVRPFSHVLPAATGGDLPVFAAKYYYAISGLPEGLTFDPETRTISGTPTEHGPFTVTYTADDPDTVGSAYLNPETVNANDVATRRFKINVRPFIDLVRVTSAPTHDANGDGRNDTYGAGDKITFDVELTEPVEVDTTPAGSGVRLRLDMGQNDDNDGNSRKTADLAGVFHGGKTLRFEYTVQEADNDPDGVRVQTGGSNKVVFVRGGATVKGLVSKLGANMSKTAFITGGAVGTDGIPMTYVNGRLTAGGPMPKQGHASVDGKTLRVVFDKELAALSAADLQALTFLFGVQGTDGTGGNRNAFQHPSSVAMWSDDSTNRTLELTLGTAVRVGETITLSYKLNNYKGPIEDTSGNMAPAFVDLVVTNITGGGTVLSDAGTLVGNTGQSLDLSQGFENDRAQAFTTGSNTLGYKLTSVAVPYTAATAPAASTHAISIHASNSSNRPGTSLGTLSYGSVSGTGNNKTITYTGDIDLASGTTYFVVLDAKSSPNHVALKLTNSDNEDSGAADGWSIADTGLKLADSGTTWTSQSDSWQIAIHGVAVVAEAAVPGAKATLVGNTGQSNDGTDGFSVEYAQAFTTGSNAGGYKLTKLMVPHADAVPPAASHTISIHASNSSNRPGASLGTLSYGTVSGTTVTYTASGNGIELDAGTTYFVAAYTVPGDDGGARRVRTLSDNEDSGAADGWSIGNGVLWRNAASSGTWNTVTSSWQIAIQGAAVTVAVTPGAKTALVRNTGQSTDHTPAFDSGRDYAQAFTTGSNTDGYKLTGVTVPYSGGVPAAASHGMWIARMGATGLPILGTVGVLTYGSVSGTTVTYNAPEGGIDLDAGTSYFVYFNALAAPTGPRLRQTNSDNEDSAADGWSLADTSLRRQSGSWTELAASWQIAIHGIDGTAKAGLQPQSASVAGTKLKIVFDEALDTGSSESGQHFTVAMSDPDGNQRTIAGTEANVGISGKTVTVTLAEAVPPKVSAQVTYDPPALSLRGDDDGTYAASFLGFKIETVYDIAVPKLKQAAVAQTSKNPDGFRVALYYDEALDPDSVPATTNFGLKLNSNAAVTPNAVALEGNTVVLTVDLAKAPGDERVVTYTEADVSYTKGTNPIRDAAGNEAAAFTGLEQTDLGAKVGVEAGGTPAVVAGTVTTTGEGTLVSNTGQSYDGTQDFSVHVRQRFTTGNNAAGYRLTKVAVPYTGAAPAASSHEILIFSLSHVGELGTKLGTLSYGSVSGSTVTYTASGEGISLAAGTEYFVFFDPLSNPSGSQLRVTASFNEDAGAGDGWRLRKVRGIWNPGDSWTSRSSVWQIAIHGVAIGGTTQKTVTGPAVDGASLTVRYDKSLDPASLPDPGRFRLLEPELEEDGNGNLVEVEYGRVAAVAVAGKQLVLTLNGAASPCDTFTLSYSRSETEKNIQTFTGHEAPDMEAAPVFNAQADRCVSGSVVVQNGEGASGNSGGTPGKQGKSLTVKFDRPLDTGKALKASAFGLARAAGGAAPAVEGAAYTGSGAGVALTLARALESGETVTLSYTRTAGEPGLWNAEGNQIADFSGVAVAGPELRVSGGDRGRGGLGLRERRHLRARRDDPGARDLQRGGPRSTRRAASTRIDIDMDPAHWGTKRAAWESGSGTASLTFGYEVVEPNESTQGIAVLANTLEANGGAIRSVSGGADAGLGHAGLDHDPAHKVDWRVDAGARRGRCR